MLLVITGKSCCKHSFVVFSFSLLSHTTEIPVVAGVVGQNATGTFGGKIVFIVKKIKSN
jgi:hypothetical protein